MQKERLHFNKKSTKRYSQGFSLVEILVAISVFLVFVLATTGVMATVSKNVRHASNSQKAALLVDEALEVVRNMRDASVNFALLPNGTYGLSTSSNQWNLSGSSDAQGLFTRSVTISSINSTKKKIVATVLWSDQTSSSNSQSASTYLTDWHAPVSIGLTVNKTVVNHGGTKVPSDFLPSNLTTMAWDNTVEPPVQKSVDIPISFSPSTMALVPGTYTFTTSNDPSYSVTLSPVCAAGSITLANGDSKLCSITYEQYVAPTIDTPTAAGITSSTATLGARVTSLGNPAAISARGVCYDTSINPTQGSAACTTAPLSQAVPSIFTISASSLTPHTTYHYRGYAVNSTGTSYTSDATFTTVSSGISFVASAAASGAIATIPAHNIGDLLVVFAYRDGNNTAPSVPAGWTTINAAGGANTNSSALAYRVATGSDTSGTWTNATEIIVQVYRGVSASPIGTNVGLAGSGNTATYSALVPSVTNGTSWIVSFGGSRATNSKIKNPPTGMVQRTTFVDSTAEVSGHDTNAGTSNWPLTTVTVDGGNTGWMTRVLEIKAQ